MKMLGEDFSIRDLDTATKAGTERNVFITDEIALFTLQPRREPRCLSTAKYNEKNILR